MSQSSPTVGICSLGCAKALVDSERILTRLRAEGYEIAATYQGSDLVIVNTCGFLDSARAESLEAIGEAIAGNGRVIVTGCLGGDAEAIRAAHPRVLAISGPQHYQAVVEAVHAALPPPHEPWASLIPPEGLHLTPPHYAYLKISEGCDNCCAFCIIPHLRGPQVSRPLAEILGEAERLAEAGVRELLVIAQDTAAYGRDLDHAPQTWRGRTRRATLPDLAEALGELGIWVRLHYLYPYPQVDQLIPLMAAGRIVPYLDIPFQHADPRVLKAMRRPAGHERLLGRLHSWRAACPDLAIRSTFIVGFPGETDDAFESLLEWLEAADLDRVGCFKYENVAGAPANALPDQIDDEVKEERHQRLTETARRIADRRAAALVGRTVPAIVDEVDEEGAIGRSTRDSPDVDGSVFLNGATALVPGDIVEVKVEAAEDYDLWGEPVRRMRPPPGAPLPPYL